MKVCEDAERAESLVWRKPYSLFHEGQMQARAMSRGAGWNGGLHPVLRGGWQTDRLVSSLKGGEKPGYGRLLQFGAPI